MSGLAVLVLLGGFGGIRGAAALRERAARYRDLAARYRSAAVYAALSKYRGEPHDPDRVSHYDRMAERYAGTVRVGLRRVDHHAAKGPDSAGYHGPSVPPPVLAVR